MFKFVVTVCSMFILVEVAGRRWHTSQIVLKQLYDLQKEHFELLNDYLDLETKRLEELLKNLAAINDWRLQKFDTKDTYLHIHTDAIKAMTWFHQKLIKVDDLMNNKQSREVLDKLNEDKNIGEDDIIYSYQALIRIQRFYGISASGMASGKYNNRIIGDQMDACECFIMTKYCYNEFDMYGVIDWAVEAYKKWINDGKPKCVDVDTLHFYVLSSLQYTGSNFGNFFGTIGLHNSKLSQMTEQHLSLMRNELIDMPENRILRVFDVFNRLTKNQYGMKFIHLCKLGTSLRTLSTYSKCRYQTKNSYYRLLMPFKEEDINSEPLIKIYHDVLYDEEILKIKSMVLNSMKDSEVNSPTGNILNEKFRSGQVNWINHIQDTKELPSLRARIELFTGLYYKTSESYQIVNYGLGGHYIPHYDAFSRKSQNKFTGNRIFTVLFYLDDLENEGYTVYPTLNIVSPVEKGAALVWQNLHKSNGSIHSDSLHGACPLLKGNKWIMTKWLYEEGQLLSYNWREIQ